MAFLTYTSGTTGHPKGAMTTHRNVVFNAQTYRDWIGIGPADVILGVAPLFHITGSIGHVALSLLTGAPVVLTYRFDPAVAIETIPGRPGDVHRRLDHRLHRPDERAQRGPGRARHADEDLLRRGTDPAQHDQRVPEHVGQYIHNIYGLTETTSPSHAVPLGGTAGRSASGALSVGVPVYNTVVRIVDEETLDLPPGEIGELVTEGPQVVDGYWNKPEETARALPGGALRTGDVGYMDDDGWFYIVDRKKDQINVGGFKVWPREVEDVLYGTKRSVRRQVGVPDPYRGETVKAYVSLKTAVRPRRRNWRRTASSASRPTSTPRQVEIIDELPKTVTGKILRRELRARLARRRLSCALTPAGRRYKPWDGR